jgi:uncharacterized protein YciI
VVKYVLFYTSGDREQAMRHFPAHRLQLNAFHERGVLLMTGAFTDPQDGGAMGIFTTREAAEEFVRDDPFVVNGAVTGWHIREWNEVLAGP